MIKYKNIEQVPYQVDVTRVLDGVPQVSYNGNFTSLFTHVVTLENQTGLTATLVGSVTDLKLTLVYPAHFILKPTIYKNGALLQSSEFTFASTGIITFAESLENANLIIILK